MSNIQQLINFISEYRTYREVSAKAFQIDPNWRSETWTRGLRRNDKIKPLYKNEAKNAPIVGYHPKQAIQGNTEPHSTLKKLSWQEKIKIEREKKKIDNYKRDENGRILLFT